MAKITAGFGASLSDAIERLGVVEGEIDNVMEAALRDIAENVADTMSGSWPIGERRYPSQMRPHSAGLWEGQQRSKLVWSIHNSAEYASHVHSQTKYGGPVGLADRVIPDLIEQIETEPLAFVTDRVLDLIGED